MTNRICFTDKMEFNDTDIVKVLSARDAYVEELLQMAAEGSNFVVTLSDNTGKGPMLRFKEAYGERLIEAGIAEGNQIGMSAGIAMTGKTVFAQVFGPFLSLRALDQVHTDIAYNDVPVRLMNTHGGLTSGGGPTHFTVIDVSIMRSIPNMTVIVPGDANQCVKAVRASIDYEGPMFIRMPRGIEPLVYTTQDYPYEIGKAVLTLNGNDVTVIATGVGVAMAVEAANNLARENISVRVIDMHTVKPLDRDIIIKAAKETGKIITVEDHLVTGGVGSAVAEVLAEEGIVTKFKRLGIPDDGFPLNDTVSKLYNYYGFDHIGIMKEVKAMLKK